MAEGCFCRGFCGFGGQNRGFCVVICGGFVVKVWFFDGVDGPRKTRQLLKIFLWISLQRLIPSRWR